MNACSRLLIQLYKYHNYLTPQGCPFPWSCQWFAEWLHTSHPGGGGKKKKKVSKQLLQAQSPRQTSGVALHHPPSSFSTKFLQHPSTSVLCFKAQPCCFHTFCLAWQAFIKTSTSSCWSSLHLQGNSIHMLSAPDSSLLPAWQALWLTSIFYLFTQRKI